MFVNIIWMKGNCGTVHVILNYIQINWRMKRKLMTWNFQRMMFMFYCQGMIHFMKLWTWDCAQQCCWAMAIETEHITRIEQIRRNKWKKSELGMYKFVSTDTHLCGQSQDLSKYLWTQLWFHVLMIEYVDLPAITSLVIGGIDGYENYIYGIETDQLSFVCHGTLFIRWWSYIIYTFTWVSFNSSAIFAQILIIFQEWALINKCSRNRIILHRWAALLSAISWDL